MIYSALKAAGPIIEILDSVTGLSFYHAPIGSDGDRADGNIIAYNPWDDYLIESEKDNKPCWIVIENRDDQKTFPDKLSTPTSVVFGIPHYFRLVQVDFLTFNQAAMWLASSKNRYKVESLFNRTTGGDTLKLSPQSFIKTI